MAEPLYECPECFRVAPWTDGTVAEMGDERDEFWCQTCGAETPLARCRRVDRLEIIRGRIEAASPGPWRAGTSPGGAAGVWRAGSQTDDPSLCVVASVPTGEDLGDAAFIAHAREDVPILIAEVERLRAENDALRQHGLDALAAFAGESATNERRLRAALERIAGEPQLTGIDASIVADRALRGADLCEEGRPGAPTEPPRAEA